MRSRPVQKKYPECASEKARPFRICLSLMDRWEIGGSIVPHMFLPAIRGAYDYSIHAGPADTAEVLRSASLFFDGVEATLIWANLLKLLKDAFRDDDRGNDNLELFSWMLQHFNIKEEEMLSIHIPHAAVYLTSLLVDHGLSANSTSKVDASLDVLSTLLDFIPERTFSTSTKKTHSNDSTTSQVPSTHTLRGSIDSFYRTKEQTVRDNLPITGDFAPKILCQLLEALAQNTFRQDSGVSFGKIATLLLTILSKSPTNVKFDHSDLMNTVCAALEASTERGQAIQFQDLSAIISLLSGFETPARRSQDTSQAEVIELEPMLTLQLWQYLSPTAPKYNVEAVKAVWQLQSLVYPDPCLEASLTALVRQATTKQSAPRDDLAEAIRRFTILWDHSIPSSSGSRPGSAGVSRRVSSMPIISDAKQASHRQRILTEPLMLVLDLLNDSHNAAFDVVASWLRSLSSLEQVLMIHLDALDTLVDPSTGAVSLDSSTPQSWRRHESPRNRVRFWPFAPHNKIWQRMGVAVSGSYDIVGFGERPYIRRRRNKACGMERPLHIRRCSFVDST